MRQRGTDAPQSAARPKVISGKSCEDGERPDCCGELPGHLGNGCASRIAQARAGRRIAAMRCAIDQGPKCASQLGIVTGSAEQPRSNAEQYASTQAETFDHGIAPRKWVEHRQPRVLKLRQFDAADALDDELSLDCMQPGLSRCSARVIQLLQPLAPPRHADRAQRRLRGSRHHVGECEIEVPECFEGWPEASRRRLKRGQPVGIEPALSDSRRPSPPPPPPKP